jgi:hypothetical protein
MQQGDSDEFRRELAVPQFKDATGIGARELIEKGTHGLRG